MKKIERIEKKILVLSGEEAGNGPARRNRRMSCDFKERLQKAVKETEAVVYEYLPAEEGYQKTIFFRHELQRKSRRETAAARF